MTSNLGRQNFELEINRLDEQIDLAKAALYIAQESYFDLDVEEYLNALDTMADEVRERLPEPRYPLKVIQTINDYLYNYIGFEGNSENYYDARNSFLNEVIDRRTGIPITLSLVYLEIARRLDFPMVGIGMPGHFLIRPNFPDAGIFIDAFNRGEVLFEKDCEERLVQIYGQAVPLQPQFLAPISKRKFLARMLTNLKYIYLSRKDFARALPTVERLILLFPDDPMELRDRGLLYYQVGEPSKAILDLETYLAMLPNAGDASTIRRLILEMSYYVCCLLFVVCY